MWGCITSDSIVRYCFDQSYGFLDAPDFKSPFVQAMVDLLDGVHLVTQLPWVMTILNALPEHLLALIQPGMKSVHDFNHVSALLLVTNLLIIKTDKLTYVVNGIPDYRRPG